MTDHSLHVRPGVMTDVEPIARFNEALARETEGRILDPEVLRAGVRAGLADPRRARYFLAESAGEIVGQLMLTLEWSDWRNGEIWWFQSVFVDPAHRRRGVFRQLFEHVDRTAADDPACVGLRLYVENENATAQRTYRDLGLVEGGYFVMQRFFGSDPEDETASE